MAQNERPLAKAPDELLKILARIDQENPTSTDLEIVREALRKYPGLWQAAGDMADQAASVMVQSVNAAPLAKEVVRGNYEGLKRDLGHESASTLERILIGQVALTWLRLQILDQAYTHKTMTSGQTFTTEEGDYWERRLSAAQRRFFRACETLARTRKMGIVALQVNIAEQQVNIAGGP